MLRGKGQGGYMKKRYSTLWMWPIVFAWGFIPLIVRLKLYSSGLSEYEWFSEAADQQADFFLYYKSQFIVIAAVVMILMFVYQHFVNSAKQLKLEPAFYCLAVYAALVMGSFMFSPFIMLNSYVFLL